MGKTPRKAQQHGQNLVTDVLIMRVIRNSNKSLSERPKTGSDGNFHIRKGSQQPCLQQLRLGTVIPSVHLGLLDTPLFRTGCTQGVAHSVKAVFTHRHKGRQPLRGGPPSRAAL